jgi:Asp-tRNA(Asn)/Glu-tRNA(Gln) amidotransferase A subunit family amidase
MMSFHCSNPVFKTTTNPFNPLYTCGGSSGGEAALLAMDGSALGFGSDIGGSLRIPPHYSGVFGLKRKLILARLLLLRHKGDKSRADPCGLLYND